MLLLIPFNATFIDFVLQKVNKSEQQEVNASPALVL
jgi:hypothetical protein